MGGNGLLRSSKNSACTGGQSVKLSSYTAIATRFTQRGNEMTASRGIIKRTDVKPIVARYVINGCKFKLWWTRADHAAAATRIAVLRANGIPVKVKGFPKRITVTK